MSEWALEIKNCHALYKLPKKLDFKLTIKSLVQSVALYSDLR